MPPKRVKKTVKARKKVVASRKRKRVVKKKVTRTRTRARPLSKRSQLLALENEQIRRKIQAHQVKPVNIVPQRLTLHAARPVLSERSRLLQLENEQMRQKIQAHQ